jgi:uncharacterized protein YbaA (DUF1428 family)
MCSGITSWQANVVQSVRMPYVDGYVLPVPRKNLAAYRKMAKEAGKWWKKMGALEYVECVGDDLKNKWGVSFSKLAKAKKGETVIFAYVVYKSKAHRDAVNKKIHASMEMDQYKDVKMPFDMKKMAYGGFKKIVDL